VITRFTVHAWPDHHNAGRGRRRAEVDVGVAGEHEHGAAVMTTTDRSGLDALEDLALVLQAQLRAGATFTSLIHLNIASCLRLQPPRDGRRLTPSIMPICACEYCDGPEDRHDRDRGQVRPRPRGLGDAARRMCATQMILLTANHLHLGYDQTEHFDHEHAPSSSRAHGRYGRTRAADRTAFLTDLTMHMHHLGIDRHDGWEQIARRRRALRHLGAPGFLLAIRQRFGAPLSGKY